MGNKRTPEQVEAIQRFRYLLARDIRNGNQKVLYSVRCVYSRIGMGSEGFWRISRVYVEGLIQIWPPKLTKHKRTAFFNPNTLIALAGVMELFNPEPELGDEGKVMFTGIPLVDYGE